MLKSMAETTTGWSDYAAHILTAARLHLNSPPASPKSWVQVNPNLNDYHSETMDTGKSTLSSPNITNQWCPQDEKHSKYTDLPNVARGIIPIVPHGVGAEASFSLGRDVNGWRRSEATGETLREKVVDRQVSGAHNQILAANCATLNTAETENNRELKNVIEERKLYRIAKVHDLLKMWQGSQDLPATQTESRVQNKQMTALGSISDTEEIIKSSWSNFYHDGAAAFQLSARSHLPPALSAKDLPGGRTQVSNVHQIRRIDRHPVENDEGRVPECISNTENWPNCNGHLDNPNDRAKMTIMQMLIPM